MTKRNLQNLAFAALIGLSLPLAAVAAPLPGHEPQKSQTMNGKLQQQVAAKWHLNLPQQQ